MSLYFQVRFSRGMLLFGLLGSGNWMNYLWAEEQGYLTQTWQLMPLILTDEKNQCELGSDPNAH